MKLTEAQQKRLSACRCPFHGRKMLWNWMLPVRFRGAAFPVSCGRKGCVVVAKAQSARGPAKLIPECVHYLNSMRRLAALEREFPLDDVCAIASSTL
jgi:hypothetical protein